MKKLKLSLLIIGGIVLFLAGGVVAATLTAKDIGFRSANEEWNVTNVEDAVNDLYEISKSFSSADPEIFYATAAGSQSISNTLSLDSGKYVVLSIFMSTAGQSNNIYYNTYDLTFTDGITVDKTIEYGENRKAYVITVNSDGQSVSHSTVGSWKFYETITAIKI